jgi:hypothetical protein
LKILDPCNFLRKVSGSCLGALNLLILEMIDLL